MPQILTHTGLMYDLESPDIDDVCILDIAHALARLCRFTGHHEWMSVAEHSVRTAREIRHRGYDRLAQAIGLMHDAHEAYTGDVSTPAKGVVGEAWEKFERRHADAVRKRFRLPRALTPIVLEVDRLMLGQEFDFDLPGWDVATAEREFLAEANRLGLI